MKPPGSAGASLLPVTAMNWPNCQDTSSVHFLKNTLAWNIKLLPEEMSLGLGKEARPCPSPCLPVSKPLQGPLVPSSRRPEPPAAPEGRAASWHQALSNVPLLSGHHHPRAHSYKGKRNLAVAAAERKRDSHGERAGNTQLHYKTKQSSSFVFFVWLLSISSLC